MTDHYMMCTCRSAKYKQHLVKQLGRNAICSDCYSQSMIQTVSMVWNQLED